MEPFDSKRTVGELVRERPSRSRVFEHLNIDYCCGGRLPLAEACSRRGLDLDSVTRTILEHDREPSDKASETNIEAMGLSELADHIVATHHEYLRNALPRLEDLLSKVTAVHGASEPRLRKLQESFLAFRQHLTEHMMREEEVLFPMIRTLETSKERVFFHCGTLAQPVRVMEFEHDDAGAALVEFRSLTDDFTPPEWACNTFRALYDGLLELERDMHCHVHCENNVLFPDALAREAALASGQT